MCPPLHKPFEYYQICKVFTAENLGLSEQSCPVAALQKRYDHLCTLPLSPVDQAQPLLLKGSDMPHLLIPIQPVCTGPPGETIAIHTELGWSLQGPTSFVHTAPAEQCLFTSTVSPSAEHFRNVE
jgi:hypothetical protein